MESERVEKTDFGHFVFHAGRHHFDFISGLDVSVVKADIDHNAAIRVVIGIENKRFERCMNISFRCRNMLDDLHKYIFNVRAGLCRNSRCFICRNADNIFYLLARSLNIG